MKKFLLIVLAISFTLIISTNSSAQMTWNHACSFSDSNYVAVPHSASLNITGNFTIEAWVNPVNVSSPSAQIILQKRSGSATGYTLYLTSGKVSIRTNSSTRLTGNTVIPNNQWTHIAGTYTAASNLFKVFINGFEDSSATFAGAAPISNTDSIFIGVGNNGEFNGLMDEVRVWNAPLPSAAILEVMRQSLGTNSGFYTGLVMSLSFQKANPDGTIFSLNDICGNNNNGVNRGVSGFSHSNSPVSTIFTNECVTLDGTGDFLSGNDHPAVSPVSAITLEGWVNPKSFNANTSVNSTIIHKGNAAGSVTDYRIEIRLRGFNFFVNETNIFGLSTSGTFFPLNKWTHFAISYNGSNGFMKFVLNGDIRWDDTNFVGNIHDNFDPIYIGGTPSLQCFDGLLDDIRISTADLTFGEMNNRMFNSINESNDIAGVNVAYNFDGGLVSNSDAGPRLSLNGNSKFILSPTSPLNFSTDHLMQAFYTSEEIGAGIRIPATGTNGFMNSDTIEVPLSETISDINVFVGLNHTDEDNLIITLISPTGSSAIIYNTTSLLVGDDITTIFDDQADSSLVSVRYTNFASTVKPQNGLNAAFAGSNTKGKWKLRIQDAAAGDTGTLYGWGIQFNNHVKKKCVLSLSALIQGFYNPVSNLMVRDTVRIYTRSDVSPFAIIDSSKSVLSDSGKADFVFQNTPTGIPVYIQFKHRNSIETWNRVRSGSTFAILFSKYFSPFNGLLIQDFSSTSGAAFGNNQILVDSGPNKFAVYNGDVNQDGSIDLTDIIGAFNDANNFLTGYVVTDVTGDNFVDLSDITLIFNNSNNFVVKVVP